MAGELVELVTFIVREPGLAARLLAEHVDDGTGHCVACDGGGQTGRHTYPCTIRAHAAAADKIDARRPAP